MLIFLVINSLHPGKFFMLRLSSAAFFKINSLKNSFSNTIRVIDGLDSDCDRHSVGFDLGPTCFQRLAADEKSRY